MELMVPTDHAHIIAPETDLSFSIKGIPADIDGPIKETLLTTFSCVRTEPSSCQSSRG